MNSRDVLTSGNFLWPQGLSSLSFDKSFFLRPDFSVESFLAHHLKQGITLETLKDDLNVHDKVLASTLVQLVDRDYNDFLNLSTNLHGLDKPVAGTCETLLEYGQVLKEKRVRVDEILAEVRKYEGKLREISKRRSELRMLKECLVLSKLVRNCKDDVIVSRSIAKFMVKRSKIPKNDMLENAKLECDYVGNKLLEKSQDDLKEACEAKSFEKCLKSLNIFENLDQIDAAKQSLSLVLLQPIINPILENVLLDIDNNLDVFHKIIKVLEESFIEEMIGDEALVLADRCLYTDLQS